MKTQDEKAEAFRALHARKGAFIIPNPWDVGTARMLAQLGFEALATTSAGFAFSAGVPDNQVGREKHDRARRADRRGDRPPGQRRSRERLRRRSEDRRRDDPPRRGDRHRRRLDRGLDQPAGREGLYELAQAVDRIRAAVEARASLPFPFTLTARAENFLVGIADLKDTIRRLQAYQEAGADVLYAPCITSARGNHGRSWAPWTGR